MSNLQRNRFAVFTGLDIDELNEQIKNLEADIKKVKHDLASLVDYAVAYYENLLKKYGKGRERKTEIKIV